MLDSRIKESSGLETASRFPGAFYTHNDSGDDARFFAIDSDGKTLAVYTLPGAQAEDWEDMSTGPGRTLWFGDIGDNSRQRQHISVYRVAEPTELVDRTLRSTRFDFKYADGRSHNAEALMVNPDTGRLYVATKQQDEAAIYSAPQRLSVSGYNELTEVASAPSVVTGGDISSDGVTLALRTYGEAYIYDSLERAPKVIELPVAGESIAFTEDDESLLVGSEGANSPVWRVRH